MESAALGDIDELLDNLQRQFLQQIIESHSAQTIDLHGSAIDACRPFLRTIGRSPR